MAYKRVTKKTGPISRRSVTYSTNGPSTYSHSTTGNGVTYTSTSKGGKYYTTRTQRFANGFVERKRIMSSSPKKIAKPRRKSKASVESNGLGMLMLIVFGVIAVAIFG